MAASTHLNCPQGAFGLQRYPRRSQEPLQAWCSADILLLETAQQATGDALVVNDDHGALAVPLGAAAVWTDSALAAESIGHNSALNKVKPPNLLWSTALPPSNVERVFMRIPKLLPYFEYQLAQLASVLPAGTPLYCTGMDKHLSPQTAVIMEKQFGVVERHKGQRKARLFSAILPGSAQYSPEPFRGYHCDQIGSDLVGLPNVFSREKLDAGSRFLLENLQHLEPVSVAADLACGNGLLGLAALHLKQAKHVLFADESAMAIASARQNAKALSTPAENTEFHHGDGLLNVTQKFDLVLCNPPFHLGHTVDDFAGRRLLQQAAQSLQPGGTLLLVANRHLEYAATLKRTFRRVEKLAQNNKFVIWRALHG
ncbi:MAG: methyltransferase [Halioglobus sp.]